MCGGDGAGGYGCITSTYLDRLIAWYVGAEEIEECLATKKLSCLQGLALSALKIKIFRKINCGKSSFTPGTQVLMADGRTRAIEDVRIGDQIMATDPESGRTEAKSVQRTIDSRGQKNLVDVTVTGPDGQSTGTLVATDNHPFWVAGDQNTWTDAGQLEPGDTLRTETGASAHVAAIKAWATPEQGVHNLTIADFHTYYVLAGATPVLVHNSDDACGVWQSEFDNLPKGRQGHVREMPDEQTMRAAFERWTAGAERLPARGPKIPDVYRLADGTVIQWRTASASGGATVDIQPGSGGKPMKIHLP